MPHRLRLFLLLSLVSVLGACAPTSRIENAPELIDELPRIPPQDGPLAIDLVYPRPGAVKPDADSTFLFGSVGTGDAELSINGLPVAVAPNGAFLAYVPVPTEGTYTFAARSNGDAATFAYAYATPPPPRPSVEPFDAPRQAVVVGGRDTLATGSQVVHAYPAPGADRRWFFPPGTELTATGRSGALVQVRLTPQSHAWIDSSSIHIIDPASGGSSSSVEMSSEEMPVSVSTYDRFVDVKIGAERAPFLISADIYSLDIVVYGREAPRSVPDADDFIESAAWSGASPDSALLQIELSRALWGFKAFFAEDSSLVVRLRKPPPVLASDPLRGLRVMVDPGHPPGGAIGPTGLTEAEANLHVALKLADMLEDRGAETVMTRTDSSGLVSDTEVATELWARVDLAVAEDVDLLVSIHNNAFADGVNPFQHFGTETYYYHPFSEPLAEALRRHLVQVTGLPDLGAKQRSLALVRPSWMPSTLTESLFMMFPQQEEALRRPEFQEKLARAHLDGIVMFLEEALE